MRNLLLSLLLLVCCSFSSSAQTDTEQILVFRRSGEVNLFLSNEVDSIVCSVYDRDSVRYSDVVSQVFFARDTTMFVPIAEIDSVAFGSRNVVEYQPNVRLLHESPLADCISRYKDGKIYFSTNTPAASLPKVGDKVLYGNQSSLFPVGLCARVVSAQQVGNEYCAEVQDVALEEVFKQLFYAGTASVEQPKVRTRSGAKSTLNVGHKFDIGENGYTSIETELDLTTHFVANPLKHYYYAKVDIDGTIQSHIAAQAANLEVKKDRVLLDMHFTPVALALFPRLSAKLFVEAEAEIQIDYIAQRNIRQTFEWTRLNGTNELRTQKERFVYPEEDQATVEILIDGSVYCGVAATLEVGLLGNWNGVRTCLRLGPELSGEVSADLVTSLREYDFTPYGNAKLNLCGRASLTGDAFIITPSWGEEKSYTFASADYRFGDREVSLFPRYIESKAVQTPLGNEPSVSATAKNETPIAASLECGFELVDANGRVVESIFTDSIYAQTDSRQGVAAEFPNVPVTEGLRVRPIFHYAGHTVAADFCRMSKDVLIQPIVAYQTNGTATGLSGIPALGGSRIGDTYYVIGPYFPPTAIDTVFTKDRSYTTGSYITADKSDLLIGQWRTETDGQQRVLTFTDNGTGSYTEGTHTLPFSYQLNNPQSGRITLYMTDQAQTYIICTLTESTLKVRTTPSSPVITYYKYE